MDFNLILTTGKAVPVPLHHLLSLQDVGLVRVSKKGVARVKRGCVAYRHEGTGEVWFVIQYKGRIERFTVKSSLGAILKRLRLFAVKYDKFGNPIYEGLYDRHDQVHGIAA